MSPHAPRSHPEEVHGGGSGKDGERLKNLPEDVKRVIAYLQAKGVHNTKRDLILRLFGPSFTGREGYRKVSKIIMADLSELVLRVGTPSIHCVYIWL
jgi:hypothetical protein